MTEEKKAKLALKAEEFVKDFLYKHAIVDMKEYTDTSTLLRRIKFPYVIFYANRDEYSLAEIQILTENMVKLLNPNSPDKPDISITVVTVQNGLASVTKEELKWFAEAFSNLSDKCDE